MSKNIKVQPRPTLPGSPVWRGRRWMTLCHEDRSQNLIILKIKPPEGRWQKVSLPPPALLRTTRAVELIVQQTTCTSGEDQLKDLLELIAKQGGGGIRDITVRSGRRGDLFVMPSRTIRLVKEAKRSVLFDSGRVARNPALAAVGRKSGSLAKWKKQVAGTVGYSSLGIIVIGAALAPSLLELSGLSESLLLNLAGRSSGGKTVLTLAAMSVQGAASRGDIVPPGFTERALEELGAGFNELLMPIDDLSRLINTADVRRTARFLTYHFSDGGGRVVSDQAMQKGLPFERFRSIGLTSYEQSSAEIARLAGVERRPGETVRMFDLVAHPDLGVFDRIPKAEPRTAAQIAKDLEDAVAAHHGVALPAFLKWVRRKGDAAVKTRLQRLIANFAAKVTSGDDAVQRRAAEKFGLIYGVLVLAHSAGVTPWAPKLVRKVLGQGFRRAISAVAPTASGLELVERLRTVLRRPEAVLEVGPKNSVKGLRGPWVLAQGFPYKGGTAAGLRVSALTPFFPSPIERDQLLAELRSRRVITIEPGEARWQTRLREGDSVEKVRVAIIDVELLG